MLFFSLWPDGGGFASYEAGFEALRREPAIRDELRQIVDIAHDTTRRSTIELTGHLGPTGLRVHARYSREEILAGLGWAGFDRKPKHFQSGVLHTRVNGADVDAFFITLRKSEADYSPTTMYRDYPLSPTLFHWETQSSTSLASPTGRRYLAGTSEVVLFVRESKRSDFGDGAPYTFLGPATYVSHTGDRPIAITWRLAHPMPADLYADSAIAL